MTLAPSPMVRLILRRQKNRPTINYMQWRADTRRMTAPMPARDPILDLYALRLSAIEDRHVDLYRSARYRAMRRVRLP